MTRKAPSHSRHFTTDTMTQKIPSLMVLVTILLLLLTLVASTLDNNHLENNSSASNDPDTLPASLEENTEDHHSPEEDEDGITNFPVDGISFTRGMVPSPEETMSFATAQLQWTKHIIENYTYHPHNVLLIDIDQDGDLDVAATIRDDARLVWHEAPNDPTDPWTEYEIDDITNVSMPDSLWSEDIDEDGDIDLLITDAVGNATYWYECPSDPKTGTWNRYTIDSNIANPHCIMTGDIDQDGDPDAVGTELSGTDLRWYQAPDDPTNAWTQVVIDSALNGTHDLGIEDMDDDGDLDIVLSEFEAGKLHWYQCPTDPVSGTWNKYTISTVGSIRGVYVEDIDEDGNPDVLACHNSGNTVYWYEAPDDPTTGTWTSHTIDSSLGSAVYIWADDMDEDGNPDIIATGEDDDVKWYEAPDDAVTGTWTEHAIDDDLDRAYYVVTGDIDEDGDPDVCVAGHDENQIVWYESNSHNYNGSDVGFWPKEINETSDGWCVAVHDIDNDGDLDMVHTDYLADTVLWSEAPDDPTDDWTTHTIGTNLDYAWDVFVADIDEDGNPDVVASASDGDRVVWYEAPDDPTTGTWTERNVTDSLDDARGVWVADIDQDGNPDVLAAGYRDCEFQWYEAPDDPTAPLASWNMYTIDWVNEAHDICVADIDEDGNPDVVGVSLDDTVEWYEAPNDPTTGSWTTHSIDTTLDSPSDVCVGDIDEDGNPDVVVSGYNTAGENIVWYEAPNDPTTGTWTQHIVEDDLDFATSIDIGDISEDGQLDIVATGDYDYVRWYECPEDPTDTWIMREVEHSWTNARDTKLADIDEDGDLDAVVSSSTRNTRWYNNEFLVINEVMFDPNGSDAGDEWLELFNPTGPVNLSGWVLESADGTVLVTFSNYYLPFNCYLIVHLGTGTDDWDFSDGIGEHYTGGTTEYLDNSENGTGLFAPISGKTFAADETTIIDFVQWDDDSSYTGDTTVYTIAITTPAIWTSGDYVDLASYVVSEGESIGRDNMSRDTNRSLDWEDHGGKDATGDTPGERNINGNYTAPESGELDPDELDDAPEDILGDYFLYVTNEGSGGGGETVIQIDNDGLADLVGDGFDGPSGLAVNETSTDLYVSDDNSAAYVVELDGTLTTILDGGELDNPNALAFDGEGRLLIADAGQGCIYRANLTTGVVETVAEYFGVPQSVAVYDEDIYFTDSAGWVYRVSEEDIPEESPEDARFSDSAVVPNTEGGLVINSTGTIYVSDYLEGKVFRVEQDGSCEELVDFSDFYARGLAIHPDNESLLFLTGYDTDQIILIDLSDNTPYLFADDASTGDLLFGPFGMAITENDYDDFALDGEGEGGGGEDEIDPDDLDDAPEDILEDYFLYVTNEGNGGGGETVVQVSSDGSAIVVGDNFDGPSGLAINETSTDLYVSDDNDGIYAVETDGTLTTVINSGLSNPNALAFDDEERLLIADAGDSIWRCDLTTGTLEHLADNFDIPQAVAVYDDDIYFTDSDGYVYRITPDDTLPVTPSTVEEFSDNSVVPFTEGGMVINSTGYIYVSDYDHGRVVMVSPDGSDQIIIDFSDFYARGLALHPDNESLLFVTGYNTDQIILVDLTDSTAYLFADDTSTGDELHGPFGMVITEYDYDEFALPQTRTVGGPDGNYRTIQSAINDARSGDIIQVASGSYNEDLTINDKNITLRAKGGEITLSGDVTIKTNGYLEIRDSTIKFDPETEYQYSVIIKRGAYGLSIHNSTLTKSDHLSWGEILSLKGTNLIIEDSVVEHARRVAFKDCQEVELKNSRFSNLRIGILGWLEGTNTPVLENLVSTNNDLMGLRSYDDADWNVEGENTNIIGNRYDIIVASSGNVYISNRFYQSSVVIPGATGQVLSPNETESSTVYVGNEFGDYPTIADALAEVANGSTIVLRAGDYNEDVDIDMHIIFKTEGNGIKLAGDIQVKDGGSLEIRDSTILFNCSHSYQYGIYLGKGGESLRLVNSTLTKADSLPWGEILALAGAKLIIEDSVVEHGRRVAFKDCQEVELNNSRFSNLRNGILGWLKGANTPVLENIVSTNNGLMGLCSYDDTDWNVEGEKNNITGSRYDIMLASSGSITISTRFYKTSVVISGASGQLLSPEGDKPDTFHVGNEFGDFPTISDALEEVANGSTIILRAGDYDENVEIDKYIILKTEVQGINLTGDIEVKEGGSLEIRNATILFNSDSRHEYGITLEEDGGSLNVVNSTLSRAGSYHWGGILARTNTNLTIDGSELEYARKLFFDGCLKVELRNSSFRYFKIGIIGNLKGDATPVLDNIVSRNNIYGLGNNDDTHWKVTGDATDITDNKWDVAIGSSGDVYISSDAYETSRIKRGATGKVKEL